MSTDLEERVTSGDFPKSSVMTYLIATAADAGLTMYHQFQLGYIFEGNKFAETVMEKLGNVPGTLATVGTEALFLYGIVKAMPQKFRRITATALALSYSYFHANGAIARFDWLVNDAVPNHLYWLPSTMMSDKIFHFGSQLYNLLEKTF